MKPGCSGIWIGRCSLADYDDGLINITHQSTVIIVSSIWLQIIDTTSSKSHGTQCFTLPPKHSKQVSAYMV